MNTQQTSLMVLVVEDEIRIAQLLQDYLHNSGYNSHWIENGSEVIEWVKQHSPDLILNGSV